MHTVADTQIFTHPPQRPYDSHPILTAFRAEEIEVHTGSGEHLTLCLLFESCLEISSYMLINVLSHRH